MGGDVGIRLLILSGKVFDSGKNLFASGPSWSGTGGFEVYLWTARTLSIELEFSGGEQGLVGASKPAVEVDADDADDHWECGRARAGIILRFSVAWESCKRRGGNNRI